jgi:hypothetical protein
LAASFRSAFICRVIVHPDCGGCEKGERMPFPLAFFYTWIVIMDKGFYPRIFLFGYPRLEVANSDLFEPLSECEVDVLRLSAEGFSNQKIG